MKKTSFLIIGVVTFSLLTGCTEVPADKNNRTVTLSSTLQVQSQQTPSVATTTAVLQIQPSQEVKNPAQAKETSATGPVFKAVPGQKFGAMVFAKVANNYATFTGTTEVTGQYGTSEMTGDICFSPDKNSAAKLPNLRGNFNSQTYFCFSNADVAKKLLGSGDGKATVMIKGYNDMTMDTSLEPSSELVKVYFDNGNPLIGEFKNGNLVYNNELYRLWTQEDTQIFNVPAERLTKEMTDSLKMTHQKNIWFGLLASLSQVIKDGEKIELTGNLSLDDKGNKVMQAYSIKILGL